MGSSIASVFQCYFAVFLVSTVVCPACLCDGIVVTGPPLGTLLRTGLPGS
jgi:hypothetical protein